MVLFIVNIICCMFSVVEIIGWELRFQNGQNLRVPFVMVGFGLSDPIPGPRSAGRVAQTLEDGLAAHLTAGTRCRLSPHAHPIGHSDVGGADRGRSSAPLARRPGRHFVDSSPAVPSQ